MIYSTKIARLLLLRSNSNVSGGYKPTPELQLGLCRADREPVYREQQDAFVLDGIDRLSSLPPYLCRNGSHVAVVYNEVDASDYSQVTAISYSGTKYSLSITQYDRTGGGCYAPKKAHRKCKDDDVLLRGKFSKEQIHRMLGNAPADLAHFQYEAKPGDFGPICSSSSARLTLSSRVQPLMSCANVHRIATS